MRDIRELTRLIAQQNDEVPYFRNSDSPENTGRMIEEEAQELREAIAVAFLTDDLTWITSELADILYLVLKMCDFLGLNADEILQIKILRNRLKYQDKYTREQAVKDWEAKGGDKKYFNDLLDVVE